MNRVRSVAIGIMLMFTLTAIGASHEHGLPSVEEQLKVLTNKLNLTAGQQRKVRPILQDLHDATLKVMEDQSMSRDERLAAIRPRRYQADKQIREFLSDQQKKKLDRYLQGPHREMHGDLSGGTPSPQH